MTKFAYIALAGAVVGGTLYASSGSYSALSTEARAFEPAPIVAATDLRGVMRRLDDLSVVGFVRSENTRRELGHLLTESTWRVAPNTVRRDVFFAGEHVLSLTAAARPAGSDQTLVEISASLPPSKFSTSENLESGDVALATEIIEHIARLQVASALPGVDADRQIDGDEFREQRGLSREATDALLDRLVQALAEPYRDAIAAARRQAERDEEAEYVAEHGSARGAWRAEQAAEQALQQVREAETNAGEWGPEASGSR
jgi:hypothetical protein